MAGMEVSDALRLKALGDEYPKLKRLLAEAMLDNAMPRNVAVKTVAPGTPFQVGRRGGHKRALGTRAPLALPQAPQAALVAGFPS